MQKTMTQQQATTRAKQILEQTAAVLHPKPTLEVNKFTTSTDQCLADIPNADKMITVSYDYWLRGIPPHQFGSIGRQIKAYWERQGYSLSEASGFDSGTPNISGVTKDDYLISLDWSADNSLSIGTTAPCIYPHGKPPPS